ncbi:MAG: NAD-dependent epimerase/dehydratase family protein [Pseudomonadota bacterium]
MKILVIGGSGFIGSHIVDAAVTAGHRVRVFDRAQPKFHALPAQVHFMSGSFSDTAMLSEAVSDVDVVVHSLSTTVPGTSNLNPVADIDGNLIGTVQLLEIMRAMNAKRLIFLSSGGTVYGIPKTDPVTEDHPLRPINSYGIVKTAIEQYLHMERHLHGLDYAVLRPSNPYGPRQGHGGVQGVIGTYLWNLARGEQIQLWGDGSVVRDFLHVEDLASLTMLAIDQGLSGCFNAGSGAGHSIRDVIKCIGQVVGKELDPAIHPARRIDVPRIVLDIGKVQNATGWSPTISLSDGVARTWQWVSQQSNETSP